MSNRFSLRNAAVLAAILTLTAGTLESEARGMTPASIFLPDGTVRYEYGRRPMPALICKPHFVCDISLDSGESVMNMAIGDSARWVIAGGQSGPGGTTPHVFVKPSQVGLDTNLVITTNKRVYDVALRSANDTKYSRISFFYPDEDAAMRAAISQQAVSALLTGTPLIAPEQADSKFKISGEPSIAPLRVFTDGARTFIEWKTLPFELPAVYAIGKDGTGQPENFRVVANRYIIDSVQPNIDLVLAASPERHGRPERRASIRHL